MIHVFVTENTKGGTPYLSRATVNGVKVTGRGHGVMRAVGNLLHKLYRGTLPEAMSITIINQTKDHKP